MLKMGALVRIAVSGGAPYDIAGELAEIVYFRDKEHAYVRIFTLEDEIVMLPLKMLSLVKKETVEIKLIKELKREVLQLKKDLTSITSPHKKKPRKKGERRAGVLSTPNDLRKKVIQEAKGFLRMYGPTDDLILLPDENKYGACRQVAYVRFHVDFFQREITVHVHDQMRGTLIGKGVAKCKATDAFNEDIGKAIALGRALSLDISRFEQAPRPAEVVVGMDIFDGYMERRVLRMSPQFDFLSDITGGGKTFLVQGGWLAEGSVTILRDTYAEYY